MDNARDHISDTLLEGKILLSIREGSWQTLSHRPGEESWILIYADIDTIEMGGAFFLQDSEIQTLNTIYFHNDQILEKDSLSVFRTEGHDPISAEEYGEDSWTEGTTFEDLHQDISGYLSEIVANRTPQDSPDLESRFNELVERWKTDTLLESSLSVMFSHPAYLEIIGMGERAIPLLLKQLESSPNHWFAALTAITGEQPIPQEAAGNLEEMKKLWLKWGQEKGIC